MPVRDSGYGPSVARGRETTSCPSPFAFLFRFRSHCFGMSEPEEHVCELVLEDNYDLDETTVVVGFIETVTYRNARRLFQILEIETVRAPPLRATETTVT